MVRLHARLIRPHDPGVGRGAGPRVFLCPVLLVVTLVIGGCSGATLAEPTFESNEALARAVLDAVARNDEQALLEMAVARDEFEEFVWPTLPVSRPEVGMPFTYVWNDHFLKSRTHLAQTLRRYGGQSFSLERVEFAGDTTHNGEVRIGRETRLIVRDTEGRGRELRLFGSVIEVAGRHKVFSFIAD